MPWSGRLLWYRRKRCLARSRHFEAARHQPHHQPRKLASRSTLGILRHRFRQRSQTPRKGVRFAIAYGGGGATTSNERNLPYEAAKSAAHGLPKDEALKAVTLYPAQILGIDDRVGSLEVGKLATLFITDGDPLDLRTQVLEVFIDGREVDLSSRHTQLHKKYKKKYE
jgi:imidazolonepropionase-like amidohydrolase